MVRVAFIVPQVDVTILKTKKPFPIGRHTQIKRKSGRLTVHFAKTAFAERITGKFLPAFCQKAPFITCLLNGEAYALMLDKRLTKRPALRLEDRDRPVRGPCGLSRTDAQAGVRRPAHNDGTLSKAHGGQTSRPVKKADCATRGNSLHVMRHTLLDPRVTSCRGRAVWLFGLCRRQ